MPDYNSAYTEILSVHGSTDRDRALDFAREDFVRKAYKNPSYHAEATRNGVVQPFLILRGDETFKCKIVAMPGDELCTGDYITAFGQTWIVKEARADDTLQKGGIIWLCNYQFKFQLKPGGDVVTRWGVFDSGVYSTTLSREKEITVLDKQFKVWIPFDDDTKLMHEDMRLAVGTSYDHSGSEVLSVFRITGRDPVGRNFGEGAHMLMLDTRSDQYNPSTDSLSLGVCDYVAPATAQAGTKICMLSGSEYVRAGTRGVTVAAAFTNNGVVDAAASPAWTVTPNEGVTITDNGDKTAVVSVSASAGMVGRVVTVTCTADGYAAATKTMKVVGLV